MKKKSKVDFGAYAFLIPAAVIYLSVIVIPVFYSLFISLFKWNGVAEKEFVGLANYINLFTNDATFMIALKNNQFRGRTVFRAFFYFPCVIAPIAVAIIWRWIYNPNIGFINQFFKVLGINFKQTWISDPKVSLYAIFAAALWQGIGQPMILFLAGLQAVSPDVLEAATIDGAGPVVVRTTPHRFWQLICILRHSSIIM